MRLIAIILLSTFAFSDCNDVDACNYGQEEDCVFSPENECCDGFVMSLQPWWNEGMCFPSEFEYNSSTSVASYLFIDVYIDDFHIENNDWIGAFNGNICVGSFRWNESECLSEVCSLNTMGFNGESYSEGYMLNGQIPTFKIYDTSENIYYNTISSEEIPPWSQFHFHFINELYAVLEYQTGDLNSDLIININDIVLLVELVLSISEGAQPTDEQLQLGDIYPDGQLNVIDIVALVNIILDQ